MPPRLFSRQIQSSLIILFAITSTAFCASDFKVLVFTKAVGTVHASIPAGIKCIQDLGAANGFSVDTSNDSSYFTDANLAKYKSVIFCNTYGELFNAAQQTAFTNYMKAGGGWIGIHSAVNCETNWTWFGGLLGNNAWRNGGLFGNFTNSRESKTHFIVKDLPDTIRFNEEYYGYKANPRTAVTVLYHSNQTDKADHPAAWCHEYDGGRAVYTVWGHYDTTYGNATYKKFLLNSIIWSSHKDVSEIREISRYSNHAAAVALVSVELCRHSLKVFISKAGAYNVHVQNCAGREIYHAGIQGGSPYILPDRSFIQGVAIVRIDSDTGLPVYCGKIVWAR
jgi:type 1 glutamine amidotransferase